MLSPSKMAGAAMLLIALPAGARTLEVGPGRQYTQPSQAAAAARDGDRIVIDPGQYFDCAVWQQNNISIEGVSIRDTVLTDKTCQGKAIFVISGSNVSVRNLTLTRARVPDGNGAGIRSEGRNLLVERVRFIDNQNGILAADQPQGMLNVRDSEFVRNGSCEQACAHGIYANRLALLRVERSVFRETREGHHIKSRALRTEVVNCDIADGPNGTASYLIDIPNGGSVIVQNNRLEKGPKTENRSAAISIGGEGVDRPTPEIRIEGNQFNLTGSYSTVFVTNLVATPAVLRGNELRGQVRPLRGDGTLSR
ncbi:hypothetical protein [Roseomonas xinghualingensis]|uniref:hypothetical protein n=1 Tax=Roseomonas xinghualingensis TaxID=2986475 RepID=UPI0021F16F2F|nr:hypothetical protein [Roseomonas sp. SXEYE001]MCV4210054.1 hypothetical protein [Roseomonas sp. SXEYE001]